MTRLSRMREWGATYAFIPKGWREIGEDEAIKAGDRFLINAGPRPDETEWGNVRKGDSRVGMKCYADCFSMHITPVEKES